MSAWTDDELRRIGQTQELEIAPVRRNGELRGRTPIWVVRARDDLYVRASIVDTINDAEHRATTLRLMPTREERT